MSYTKTFPITVAQLNCNGAIAYQETLFETAIKQKIDLLLIQEPYLRPDGEPLHHQSFTIIRPDLSKELRVVAYILNKISPFTYTIRSDIIQSPYILPIE